MADLENPIAFSINTVVLDIVGRGQREGMQSFIEKRRAEFDR